MIRPSAANPIADLFPPAGSYVKRESEGDVLAALNKINRAHEAQRDGDSRLDARIRSYEMAARMQLSAPEVLDISHEPAYIRAMYGLDAPDVKYDGPMNPGEETRNFGRNCLVARRLLERGVRFVLVYPSGLSAWDSHQKLKDNHEKLCANVDLPIAGLLHDLKQRGLMEDVLVVFCTEFGRTPRLEQRGAGKDGRDHHPHGFTIWFAGAGINGGTIHGATDELGYHALGDGHYVTDIHATVLHLLGLDPRKLEVPGRKRLEIDHGATIREILA